MIFFGAALLAPVLGALLYSVLHGRPTLARYVDRAVLVLVPVLVAWQVFPHAWEHRSLTMVGAFFAGFLIPAVLERLSHYLAEHTDNVAIVVWLTGFALHQLLEGAAFADPGGVDPRFGIAVALHGVPAGLILWWLIRPRFGVGLASAALATMMLTMVAGLGLGTEFLGEALGEAHAHSHSHGVSEGTSSLQTIDLYQAFVSGTLLHVVFHQGRHDHDHDHEHT